MSSTEQQSNKPHRAGGKDDKKPKYEKGKNPRAFISQSGAKASRLARQNVEKEQKKLHVPAIDRTFGGHGAGPAGSKSSTLGSAGSSVDPPPVIVAVMGPPGVSSAVVNCIDSHALVANAVLISCNRSARLPSSAV
jgi:ribosome biogenesis protein BMS1